jgi:hypothetical protein
MALPIELRVLASKLEQGSDDLLIAASQKDPKTFEKVATAIAAASTLLESVAEDLESTPSDISEKQLEELAALASSFDESGDEFLQKQASVLDEILLSIAAPKNAVANARQATEDEINRLRQERRNKVEEELYKAPAEVLSKAQNVSGQSDAVEKEVKHYAPLEAPLMTRYPPDRPGGQMTRITDGVYQDVVTGKVYDFNNGYTTDKGQKIPGGSVANQTRDIGFHQGESMFQTRESLTNRYAGDDDLFYLKKYAMADEIAAALKNVAKFAPNLLDDAIECARQDGLTTDDVAAIIGDISNADYYGQLSYLNPEESQAEYENAVALLSSLKLAGWQSLIDDQIGALESAGMSAEHVNKLVQAFGSESAQHSLPPNSIVDPVSLEQEHAPFTPTMRPPNTPSWMNDSLPQSDDLETLPVRNTMSKLDVLKNVLKYGNRYFDSNIRIKEASGFVLPDQNVEEWSAAYDATKKEFVSTYKRDYSALGSEAEKMSFMVDTINRLMNEKGFAGPKEMHPQYKRPNTDVAKDVKSGKIAPATMPLISDEIPEPEAPEFGELDLPPESLPAPVDVPGAKRKVEVTSIPSLKRVEHPIPEGALDPYDLTQNVKTNPFAEGEFRKGLKRTEKEVDVKDKVQAITIPNLDDKLVAYMEANSTHPEIEDAIELSGTIQQKAARNLGAVRAAVQKHGLTGNIKVPAAFRNVSEALTREIGRAFATKDTTAAIYSEFIDKVRADFEPRVKRKFEEAMSAYEAKKQELKAELDEKVSTGDVAGVKKIKQLMSSLPVPSIKDFESSLPTAKDFADFRKVIVDSKKSAGEEVRKRYMSDAVRTAANEVLEDSNLPKLYPDAKFESIADLLISLGDELESIGASAAQLSDERKKPSARAARVIVHEMPKAADGTQLIPIWDDPEGFKTAAVEAMKKHPMPTYPAKGASKELIEAYRARREAVQKLQDEAMESMGFVPLSTPLRGTVNAQRIISDHLSSIKRIKGVKGDRSRKEDDILSLQIPAADSDLKTMLQPEDADDYVAAFTKIVRANPRPKYQELPQEFFEITTKAHELLPNVEPVVIKRVLDIARRYTDPDDIFVEMKGAVSLSDIKKIVSIANNTGSKVRKQVMNTIKYSDAVGPEDFSELADTINEKFKVNVTPELTEVAKKILDDNKQKELEWKMKINSLMKREGFYPPFEPAVGKTSFGDMMKPKSVSGSGDFVSGQSTEELRGMYGVASRIKSRFEKYAKIMTYLKR